MLPVESQVSRNGGFGRGTFELMPAALGCESSISVETSRVEAMKLASDTKDQVMEQWEGWLCCIRECHVNGMGL